MSLLATQVIGAIADMVVAERSGMVTAAVIEAGGFLGMGAERHEVAWQRLVWDARLEGFLLPDLVAGEGAVLRPA